uniref:ARAD1D03080p n=1 Tax=Blastobotrys adeninivorans TaxID=409370 RepID=A0A060TDV5_BLAAD
MSSPDQKNRIKRAGSKVISKLKRRSLTPQEHFSDDGGTPQQDQGLGSSASREKSLKRRSKLSLLSNLSVKSMNSSKSNSSLPSTGSADAIARVDRRVDAEKAPNAPSSSEYSSLSEGHMEAASNVDEHLDSTAQDLQEGVPVPSQQGDTQLPSQTLPQIPQALQAVAQAAEKVEPLQQGVEDNVRFEPKEELFYSTTSKILTTEGAAETESVRIDRLSTPSTPAERSQGSTYFDMGNNHESKSRRPVRVQGASPFSSFHSYDHRFSSTSLSRYADTEKASIGRTKTDSLLNNFFNSFSDSPHKSSSHSDLAQSPFIYRTASRVWEEVRESKGQSWLDTRLESTALDTDRDEDDDGVLLMGSFARSHNVGGDSHDDIAVEDVYSRSKFVTVVDWILGLEPDSSIGKPLQPPKAPKPLTPAEKTAQRDQRDSETVDAAWYLGIITSFI